MNPSPSLDVIITAGDRHASRPVLGENKAFLPVAGTPVLYHVLSAVERARYTARIFVVGNKSRLEQLLSVPQTPFRGTCPVVLIEQGETLYDNVWTTFLQTLPEYTPGADWHPFTETTAIDKAVLVMPGDMPLATPFEIDEFVEGCDLTRYDYCLGLTSANTLSAYYPQQHSAGIQLAYFTLRDLQARQNNLHLVKPFRLGNRHYIQRIYNLRYQREWHNIVKLCLELCCTREVSPRLIWAFLCLHMARFVSRYGWPRLYLCRPFFLDLSLVASLLSRLLRTRFTTVMTHYGGCALDVDNAEHYAAICTNFDRWMAHQETLAKTLKQQNQSV